MGRTCCVPKCRSNSGSHPSKNISTFAFPKDPERREDWKKRICRPDLEIRTHGVCIKHFDPQFIIKSDIFETVGGKTVEIPRQIPKLTDDAIPTIFADWPGYKTICLPPRRTDPKERARQIQLREERKKRAARLAAMEAAIQAKQQAVMADKIKGFDDFKNSLPYKNIEPFTASYRESYIIFFKVDDDNFSSIPSAKLCFKVCDTLDINVFINHKIMPLGKYNNLLGETLKCDQWSKLADIIAHLGSSDLSPPTFFDEIKSFVRNTAKTAESQNDLDKEILMKLKFLLEQLSLLTIPVPRYLPETLTWAAALFDEHPRAYDFLRESKNLTLPNPHYLQRFLCKFKKIISGSYDRNLDLEFEEETNLAVHEICQSLLETPVSDNDGDPVIKSQASTSLALQQLCQSLELDVAVSDIDGEEATPLEIQELCETLDISTPVFDTSDHTYSLDLDRKEKNQHIFQFINMKHEDEYLESLQ